MDKVLTISLTASGILLLTSIALFLLLLSARDDRAKYLDEAEDLRRALQSCGDGESERCQVLVDHQRRQCTIQRAAMGSALRACRDRWRVAEDLEGNPDRLLEAYRLLLGYEP